MNLGKNLDDLVICEALNAEMEIAALIAEMNICTTSWKGTDYMAAPAMALGEKNEVFDFAVELQTKASRWRLSLSGVRVPTPSNRKTL